MIHKYISEINFKTNVTFLMTQNSECDTIEIK